MHHLNKYKGIIPAFYSCYDDSGEISPERTKRLARFYLEQGVKGLYVEGSSGESIYHTVDERKLVLESVMEEVGGKLTVIAHVAAPSTRDSIELAIHAQKVGADAIAAIPGLYYALSEPMVERYWCDIISSVDLDMIIYNIPQSTGFELSLSLLNKMLKSKRVVGVKNSSLRSHDIQKYKAAGGDNIVVFNGVDEQFIAGRMMGAEGGIGGTYGVMPELYLALDKLIRKGDIEEASRLQFKVNDVIQELCSFPCMYASIKAVLQLRGLETGGVRLPFLPIVESDMDKIESIYAGVMRLIDTYSG